MQFVVFEARVQSLCYPSVHVCLCTVQTRLSFLVLDGECTVSKFILKFIEMNACTSKTAFYCLTCLFKTIQKNSV